MVSPRLIHAVDFDITKRLFQQSVFLKMVEDYDEVEGDYDFAIINGEFKLIPESSSPYHAENEPEHDQPECDESDLTELGSNDGFLSDYECPASPSGTATTLPATATLPSSSSSPTPIPSAPHDDLETPPPTKLSMNKKRKLRLRRKLAESQEPAPSTPKPPHAPAPVASPGSTAPERGPRASSRSTKAGSSKPRAKPRPRKKQRARGASASGVEGPQDEPMTDPTAASHDHPKRSADAAKRERLGRKSTIVPTDLLATELPHSKQGYLGGAGPRAPKAPQKATGRPNVASETENEHPGTAQLRKVLEMGYVLVEIEDGPTLFLDAAGRIVGWRTSTPGTPDSWAKVTEGTRKAMLRLYEDLKPKSKCRKRAAGASRGHFDSAHFGHSYGGGQKAPTSFTQSPANRKAWERFLKNPDVQRMLKFIKDSFHTFAPKLFEHYTANEIDLFIAGEILDMLGKDYPFATATANFGPQTICWDHLDLKNLAAGLCVIAVLGKFNPKLGGHLILHELKLVVEMGPGDVIFIPSAVITHGNIPIAPGETRQSLVLYSAGGLFRWTAAGKKTYSQWRHDDPDAFNRHQKEGEKRWREGWNLFMTWPPTPSSSSSKG